MDSEVKRLIDVMRTAMRVLDISDEDLERQTGQSAGTLIRVFSGEIELTAEHLLQIPKALGMKPGELFQLAYPERPEPGSPAAVDFREAMRDLGIAPEEARPEDVSQEQLQALAVGNLEKLLRKR